jgi:hypothetical protein
VTEYESLSQIIAKTLIGKTLLYHNSKHYKNAKITDVVNVRFFGPHEHGDDFTEPGSCIYTLSLESGGAGGKIRKGQCDVRNDDQLTLE